MHCHGPGFEQTEADQACHAEQQQSLGPQAWRMSSPRPVQREPKQHASGGDDDEDRDLETEQRAKRPIATDQGWPID
jgi:hypothetical protein